MLKNSCHSNRGALRLLKWEAILFAIPLGLLLIFILTIGVPSATFAPLPDTITLHPLPLLIAHRGATISQPGNTIASIQSAVDRGFPAVEIDIQFSADGQFFLLHDRNTRLALGIDQIASAMTISELQSFQILYKGEPTKEIVPTLDSVMAQFSDRLLFYFDIKGYGHSNKIKLANDLAQYIKQRNLQDRVMVGIHIYWLALYMELAHSEVLTVLEVAGETGIRFLRLLPQRVKPDLLADYQNKTSDDFAGWINAERLSERFVIFHVEESNFKRALRLGYGLIMVNDGWYLDSVLSDGHQEMVTK